MMNIAIRGTALLYGLIFLVGAFEGNIVQFDGLIGALAFIVRGLVPESRITSPWVLALCITGVGAVCWRAGVLFKAHTDVAEISLQLGILFVGMAVLMSAIFKSEKGPASN